MEIREKLYSLIDESGACFNCFPCEDYEKEEKYKIADYLITNGVTIQEWIPVSEGLPDPFETVWVYDATANETSAAYITIHKEWVGVCMSHEITHWMQPPQPPKGE